MIFAPHNNYYRIHSHTIHSYSRTEVTISIARWSFIYALRLYDELGAYYVP